MRRPPEPDPILASPARTEHTRHGGTGGKFTLNVLSLENAP